jgi:hypothetical protein
LLGRRWTAYRTLDGIPTATKRLGATTSLVRRLAITVSHRYLQYRGHATGFLGAVRWPTPFGFLPRETDPEIGIQEAAELQPAEPQAR